MERLLVGIIAFVLALATSACGGGEATDREGQAQMPASSQDLVGEHFEVVVEELEGAGFTNIETRPLGDLITGWLKDDGEVEKIRIDGSNTFSKGKWFAADTKIVITYHSFPERDNQSTETKPEPDPATSESEPNETTPAPEPGETKVPPTKAEPEPKDVAETDEVRSAALEARLREIFGGVESMTELLFEMPDEWPGYVVDVRVEGSHAYFTLQVDGSTPDGQQLGEQATRALSTLLGKDDVKGIDWLIVEDGAGVVIDQTMPSPNY